MLASRVCYSLFHPDTKYGNIAYGISIKIIFSLAIGREFSVSSDRQISLASQRPRMNTLP